MSVPLDETKSGLREDPVLEPIVGYSPKKQSRLFAGIRDSDRGYGIGPYRYP